MNRRSFFGRLLASAVAAVAMELPALYPARPRVVEEKTWVAITWIRIGNTCVDMPPLIVRSDATLTVTTALSPKDAMLTLGSDFIEVRRPKDEDLVVVNCCEICKIY